MNGLDARNSVLAPRTRGAPGSGRWRSERTALRPGDGPRKLAPGTHRRRAAAGSATSVILMLCLLALAPVAWASPPDPVWVEGMYDGADRDEAVGMATALAGAVELRLLPDSPPIIATRHSPADPSGAGIPRFGTLHGRSPPGLRFLPS